MISPLYHIADVARILGKSKRAMEAWLRRNPADLAGVSHILVSIPPDDIGDNAPTCTQPPQPPNSFDPKVKWTWTDPGSTGFFQGSMVTPLVANFTDDNNDGERNSLL